MSRFITIARESQETMFVALVYCLAVGAFFWMSASPAIH